MSDTMHERAQGWFAKIILALIVISFAMFGVNTYFSGGKMPVVAEVGDQQITQNEFQQALKNQQERLRSAMGRDADPALLESRERRQAVLDALIDQRLLAQQATHAGYGVSEAQLSAMIVAHPAFQQDGKFSQERLDALLRQQHLTQGRLMAILQQDVLNEYLRKQVGDTVIVPAVLAENAARLVEQQREISQAVISPEQFMAQVKLAPDAVKTYYDSHPDEFRIPDQVRIEYVTFAADSLLPQLQVSDEEARNYYTEHANQYQGAEERQFSHILIRAAAGASAAEQAAVRSKAEDVLKQAKQNPARFSELAKQYSQDPGTAERGGDMGFVARGMMPKSLDDALFQMTAGGIGGPVQSDAGWHILMLKAVKPAKHVAFEEAKEAVVLELKKQKANQKFAERADVFNNMVYEQSGTLKPVSDEFKLPIQTSGWISKSGGADGVLKNGKLLQAVFSDESLKQKRNTEAVEVAQNTLVAARVLEYKAASLKPLEQVSAEISNKLQQQQATAAALEQGRARLADLQQGKTVAALSWSAPQQVVRQHEVQGLSEAEIKQIFKADAGKLPAYAGAGNARGGFTLFKISRVTDGGKLDTEKRKAYQQNLQQLFAQEYLAAYLNSLKSQIGVKIRSENLEKKEQ